MAQTPSLRFHGFWMEVAALVILPACPDSHDTSDAGVDVGGSDVGAPIDGGPGIDAPPPNDTSLPWDAPVTFSCDPDDARAVVCPSAICDGLDSFAWDGERCVQIDCGTCEGTDCGILTHTLTACQAAHASCEAALCAATGGAWLFHVEECEHYFCGNPQPAECLVGGPVCNCGDGREFVDGLGCMNADCPVVDPLPPQTVCEASGGTWTPGICCPTSCGQLCGADCAAPACACGPLQTFDAIRGCVDDVLCHTRVEGQTCTVGTPTLRCEDGLLCCQNCGGAGCDPEAHCRVPLCDADPDTDECGNNLRAP